jgi:hypothetical protein
MRETKDLEKSLRLALSSSRVPLAIRKQRRISVGRGQGTEQPPAED